MAPSTTCGKEPREVLGELGAKLSNLCLLLGVAKRAVGAKGLIGGRDRMCRRQHSDADIAENCPHVDQAAQAAKGPGRSAQEHRSLVGVARQRGFALDGSRNPVDRVLEEPVIELLYSGEAINKP